MFKIKDDYTLQFSDKEIGQVKDNIISTGNKTLYARIAATHAGLINRNNFLYLPDKMRSSVGTFLTPFQKPILVNHNETSDPIGRIVSAKYVDTSFSVKDSVGFLTDKYKLNDSDFRRFLYGEMELMDQVGYIQDTLYDKMLDDPNFSGLGYAEIIGHIKDADAVEKFLDQRYLTGSVAAGTDHAICSICKEDWTGGSGRCEHNPGKVYDKKKAFLIGGNFTYEHWAVVNTPADGHSQTLEVSTTQVLDSKKEDEYTLSNISVELLNNFSEEGKMEVNDTTTSEVKTDEVKTEDTVQVEQVTVETKIEDAFDSFMLRVLDETNKLSVEDEEKLYQLMLDEMKAEGLSEQEITDATLSTEKRKKLAKSTFCGPGRSFPVPDCAHVVAARRLVGRYKGEGSKEGIMACVDRKAKAMGCDKSKTKEEAVQTEDTVQPTETEVVVEQVKDSMNHIAILQMLIEVIRTNKWAYEEDKPLTEEQLGMVQELLVAMAQLATTEKMAETMMDDKVGLKPLIQDKLDSTMLDEVAKLETLIGELRDTNSNLQEELKLNVKETEVLRDETVKAKVALRELRLDNLSLVKSLKDKTSVSKESLLSLNDSAIDAELESLKDFSIASVIEKLSDGLSREPQGVVDNPMEIVDNSKENEILITDELKKIEETYLNLLLKDSRKAQIYLNTEMSRLDREGKLPKKG